MFKADEPSAPLSPEREAARQLLNDAERSVIRAMERGLGRSPLKTEGMERPPAPERHSRSRAPRAGLLPPPITHKPEAHEAEQHHHPG
jgi:hypothetical protein